MEEVWKDIPDFEGLYQVSNYGKVKSLERTKQGCLEFYRPDKLLKPGLSHNGYQSIHLCNKDKKKSWRVNRLVATVFIPNPDNKPQVNHIDGNKLNNRADNLEWSSPKENTHHAIRTGLSDVKGESNGCAKLTNEDVLFIRSCGLQTKVLVEKFGVYRTLIQRIRRKGSWKHI